ncbi:MAG: peptidase [Actinomycetales bacterium]|nr:MAG: peptidase [Actinomycetales bacterium]
MTSGTPEPAGGSFPVEGVISGPRPGRMRQRRGRGPRGPFALPGPLSPRSVPAHRTPRDAFDNLVAAVLEALEKHFAAEPDEVDVVVEDVPLSSVTRSLETGDGPGPQAARIVLYRLPIAGRSASPLDLEDLVWRVVLDRLAEVWQVSPDDLDPR